MEDTQTLDPTTELEPSVARERAERVALGLVHLLRVRREPPAAALARPRVFDAGERVPEAGARLQALVDEVQVGVEGSLRGGVCERGRVRRVCDAALVGPAAWAQGEDRVNLE